LPRAEFAIETRKRKTENVAGAKAVSKLFFVVRVFRGFLRRKSSKTPLAVLANHWFALAK
jgi:hypothetical protein